MFSKEELVGSIKSRIGKLKVIRLTEILEKEHFAIRDLVNLTFHPDKDIAFRAAWLVENLLLKNPELYINELEYLIYSIREVTNPSCKRHYAKIVMHITRPTEAAPIRKKLEKIDLEPVVEQFFDWLIDPKVLIAVKVFSAEALFNLRTRYPWVKEELAEQLLFMMRNGTAAIQSRRRKLLAQL